MVRGPSVGNRESLQDLCRELPERAAPRDHRRGGAADRRRCAANRLRSCTMTNMTLELNRAGQSLWLDNITRELLSSGTLRRYIDELSITGLTSNPTIFDHAM